MPEITKDENADNDFTITGLEKCESLWLSLAGFSINLTRTDEGVAVDIYAKGREDDDALAGTYAFDQEVNCSECDEPSTHVETHGASTTPVCNDHCSQAEGEPCSENPSNPESPLYPPEEKGDDEVIMGRRWSYDECEKADLEADGHEHKTFFVFTDHRTGETFEVEGCDDAVANHIYERLNHECDHSDCCEVDVGCSHGDEPERDESRD